MRTALLLIAHGSRESEANDDLHFLAQRLRERGEFDLVATAFLELAEPTVAVAASQCVEHGASRVVMLPYFLSAGIHVQRDLTAHRATLASRYPEVDFRLALPLGRHPLLPDVVADRAREAIADNQTGSAKTSSASRT
jgi:sirohydrochlorin ferrochelatase